MLKKLTKFILAASTITVLPSIVTVAEEVPQVETPSTVSFTGVYETIGAPDPILPEIIVKPPTNEVGRPDGMLPQTNDIESFSLLILGILIICFFFLLWKKQKIKVLRK